MTGPARSGDGPVVEVRDLAMVFDGRRVVDVPSLSVCSGEVLVIIGPNGSGKSTLLLCMALLAEPSAGLVSYFGEPVTTSAAALRCRRRLAMVFQEPLLLDATVLENAMLGLSLRGVDRAMATERAGRWLGRFGIGSLAARRARTLSGGEAQRASLARALVVEPEVLFLDEPFSALDAPTRQLLIEDLQAVLRETGVTTVLVTHDRTEALTLADRVAVVIGGRIRQVGSPRSVFSSPVDEQVAAFAGVENILDGEVTGQRDGVATVAVGARHLASVSTLPVGSPVAVCLRPEDVTLSIDASGSGASSARNRLAGRVEKTCHLGSLVRVTVDCGLSLAAIVTCVSFEELSLSPGREVVATFKASSVHLIKRSKGT